MDVLNSLLKHFYASEYISQEGIMSIVQSSIEYLLLVIPRCDSLIAAVAEKDKMITRQYVLSFLKNSLELIAQCLTASTKTSSKTRLVDVFLLKEAKKHFQPMLLQLVSIKEISVRNQLQFSLANLLDVDASGQAHLVFETIMSEIIKDFHVEMIATKNRSTAYDFFFLFQKTLKVIQDKTEEFKRGGIDFAFTLKLLISIIKTATTFELKKTDCKENLHSRMYTALVI